MVRTEILSQYRLSGFSKPINPADAKIISTTLGFTQVTRDRRPHRTPGGPIEVTWMLVSAATES
jgi:hypothetical protein